MHRDEVLGEVMENCLARTRVRFRLSIYERSPMRIAQDEQVNDLPFSSRTNYVVLDKDSHLVPQGKEPRRNHHSSDA